MISSGHGIKLMIPITKIGNLPFFPNLEFPDYIRLYRAGVRRDEWRYFWLSNSDENYVVEPENDYLKINDCVLLYNIPDPAPKTPKSISRIAILP